VAFAISISFCKVADYASLENPHLKSKIGLPILASVNPPSESFHCSALAIQTSLIAFGLIAAL
jgi:hypothetical protein